MPEEVKQDAVIEEAWVLWQKYFSLTQELLKFINKQDIDTFLTLVPQRSQLIEKLEALPSQEFKKVEKFKELAEKIKPIDREIIYKARTWLNKSRRQNSAVRSYDLTNSVLGNQSMAFNRKY